MSSIGLYYINYFFIFVLTIFFTIVCVLFIKKLALKFNIVDKPTLLRKIHKSNIPLIGGLAIFLPFFLMLYFLREKLLAGELSLGHWIGFFAGACFLMIGGFLDDKYNLKAKYQIIFPILAVISVIIGGIEIEKITNPFGGYFYLNKFTIPFLNFGDASYCFIIISDLVVAIWLLGMMYTTKLLDGIDGLVSGITAIGGIIIFLFTITTKYYQPDIGLASLILAGACLGFLIFNWHPAKIFLGEGGSLFLGYSLGVLAIISGGKIAIALLIMGIPVLDLLWTIIRRIYVGKNPFKFSDRKHLHHRLLDFGIGQKKTVLIFYFLATIFGISGLFLESIGKMLALLALFIVMLIIVICIGYVDKKNT